MRKVLRGALVVNARREHGTTGAAKTAKGVDPRKAVEQEQSVCSEALAVAFDDFARDYRSGFEKNWVATFARRRAWGLYEKVFADCRTVLDLGCGPGIDSVFLSDRGVNVIAVDVSAAMLAQVPARGGEDGRGRITRVKADLNNPKALHDVLERARGVADGALLGFGSVNFIEDLRDFFLHLAGAMAVPATVLVGTANRWCVWDLLYQVLRHHRVPYRWRPQPCQHPVQGIDVQTWFRTECDVRRSLPDSFSVVEAVGVGAVAPPPYLHTSMARIPRTARALCICDRFVERWWLARLCADLVWVICRPSGHERQYSLASRTEECKACPQTPRRCGVFKEESSA